MWGQQGWFLSKSQDSGSCAIAWSSFDQQYALALLEFWSLGTNHCVCVGWGAFRGILWEVVSQGDLRPQSGRAGGGGCLAFEGNFSNEHLSS